MRRSTDESNANDSSARSSVTNKSTYLIHVVVVVLLVGSRSTSNAMNRKKYSINVLGSCIWSGAVFICLNNL